MLEVAHAALTVNDGMARPPVRKDGAVAQQLLYHLAYILFAGMRARVGSELGHDTARTLFPIDHQRPRGGIQKNVAQQIGALVALGPAIEELEKRSVPRHHVPAAVEDVGRG